MTETQQPGESLRAAAIAAAQDARDARVATARGILADRLTPAPVDALTVADESEQRVVFADAADGMHLAVTMTGPTVHLVTGDGAGGWIRRTEVQSLAHLGLILTAETGA